MPLEDSARGGTKLDKEFVEDEAQLSADADASTLHVIGKGLSALQHGLTLPRTALSHVLQQSGGLSALCKACSQVPVLMSPC